MRQSLAKPSGTLERTAEPCSSIVPADDHAESGRAAHRFAMLDGWRALSITLVLAAHLLPLGPKSLHLNDAVAPMGMVVFFTLSGFLVPRFLAAEPGSVRTFVIRRFFR